MTTLTIEVPEKVTKTLTDMVELLGGKVVGKKISRKDQEFLKGFEEAIEFVNQHQQGKVKAKTIDELMNEL